MPDTAEALNRIVAVLSDKSFFEAPVGQVLSLLLAAVLGAAAAYYFAVKQDRDKEAANQQLLTVLLGDEIALRWADRIGKDLSSYLGSFNLNNLSEICGTTFLPHDLFIFKQCAENVFGSNVFKDNTVVSRIAYVHALSRDLADELETLKKLFAQSRRSDVWDEGGTEKTDLGPKERSLIESLKPAWDSLIKTYKKLDTEMKIIYSHIEPNYRRCIDTSGFVRQGAINIPDIENRLSEVIAKRT